MTSHGSGSSATSVELAGPRLDRPVPIAELLRAGLDATPEAPALVSSAERWSWRDVDRRSDNLATQLVGLGLRSGDRVASLMPNSTGLVIHYLACTKAGLVATPLNYRYQPPEIDHALQLSEASLLLAHDDRAADVAASRLAGSLPIGTLGSRQMAELMESPKPGSDPSPAEVGAPAFIFFTSGSTGPAKGVTHTLETLGWIVASTIAGLELEKSDVFLTASSLSHEGGVGFSFAALTAGARVAVAVSSDAEQILPLLRSERPTVVWMLPAALIALVRHPDVRRDDFASARLWSTGGDKAPRELEREFAALTGSEIFESYGMTEIGCATINPPSGPNKPGSMGRLSPGYSGSIRSADGRGVVRGEEGHLWIRSGANTIGYWNDPQATHEMIRDGWLDTGDVVRGDADGYLFFRGRNKQIIVHDGSNICPQEVESALLEHPAVASAGVIGVHDLVHGEDVRAYVSFLPGAARPDAATLIGFVRERVGYKAPEEIVVLDEMPLTPVGKLDRTALKRLAEARAHRDDV